MAETNDDEILFYRRGTPCEDPNPLVLLEDCLLERESNNPS